MLVTKSVAWITIFYGLNNKAACIFFISITKNIKMCRRFVLKPCCLVLFSACKIHRHRRQLNYTIFFLGLNIAVQWQLTRMMFTANDPYVVTCNNNTNEKLLFTMLNKYFLEYRNISPALTSRLKHLRSKIFCYCLVLAMIGRLFSYKFNDLQHIDV